MIRVVSQLRPLSGFSAHAHSLKQRSTQKKQGVERAQGSADGNKERVAPADINEDEAYQYAGENSKVQRRRRLAWATSD